MKKIAVFGEQLVGRWLELQNYELLKQNWRCRWGEIDLIAQDRVTKAIAFIEVKTRSQHNWDQDGLLAVDTLKQQKLLKTASLFLAKHPHLAELPCRFDVGLVSYQLWNSPLDNISEISKINQLRLGCPIVINRYQMTIKHYLEAAFD
ncbi:MAG: YraN family protein [Cyanobacteria bacterium P01_G01_bin.67]